MINWLGSYGGDYYTFMKIRIDALESMINRASTYNLAARKVLERERHKLLKQLLNQQLLNYKK